jgi:hypothetical protein
MSDRDRARSLVADPNVFVIVVRPAPAGAYAVRVPGAAATVRMMPVVAMTVMEMAAAMTTTSVVASTSTMMAAAMVSPAAVVAAAMMPAMTSS